MAVAEKPLPDHDAGIFSLTAKLLHFREIDMDDPDAVTILDRTKGADGKPYLRSLHTHHVRADRPFARVEVLYDPDTMLPVEITSFDWPDSDQQPELLLAEHYSYENLDLTAACCDLDFDPANPAYEFRRY